MINGFCSFFEAAFRPVILISMLITVVTAQSKPSADQKKAVKSPVKSDGAASKISNSYKELTPNQQRSLLILESLVKETVGVTDNKQKIKIKAYIADSLWEYNPSRSTQIFTDTFHDIDALEFPEEKFDSRLPAKVTITRSVQFQLRQEMLSLIAMRDFSLAEKLRASYKEKGESKKDAVDPTKTNLSQALQELLIAKSLVKSNPQMAAQIVRNSFRIGITPTLVSVLKEMRHEELNLANSLFIEAVDFARKQPGSLADSIGPLLFYLPQSEEKESLGSPSALKSEMIKVTQLYLGAVQDVLVHQISLAGDGIPVIDGQEAQIDYMVLQELYPLFEKYMPNGLSTIRLRMSQYSKYLPPQQIEKAFSQETSYSDLLASAESASDIKQKDRLYTRAAVQATQEEFPDEALSIALKINNKEQQAIVITLIHYRTALRLLGREDITSVYKHLRQIESILERVNISKQVASYFIKKKDFQHAGEVLTETETWLDKQSDGINKAQGFLNIAGTTSSYDPDHGFEVVKLAVKAINNIEAFPTIKPNIKQSIINESYYMESLDFSRTFYYLALRDFDRAMLIAQSIQKKEISIYAQFTICKALLSNNQPIR